MNSIVNQIPRFDKSVTFAEHDAAFWKIALDTIAYDAAHEIGDYVGRTIVMEAGACSHWLRPHQTRWTANGGFAWPSGYGGRRWSRTGLPQLDWFFTFEWSSTGKTWFLRESSWEPPKRHFCCVQHCHRARHGTVRRWFTRFGRPARRKSHTIRVCEFTAFVKRTPVGN